MTKKLVFSGDFEHDASASSVKTSFKLNNEIVSFSILTCLTQRENEPACTFLFTFIWLILPSKDNWFIGKMYQEESEFFGLFRQKKQ